MSRRASQAPAVEVERLERATADQAARLAALELVGEPTSFALAVLRALRVDLAWRRWLVTARGGSRGPSPG